MGDPNTRAGAKVSCIPYNAIIDIMVTIACQIYFSEDCFLFYGGNWSIFILQKECFA